MKVTIIGGGAGGLMLASILKKHNANVDIEILEKLDHVGKKLLLTGNGKCNLTNKNINIDCYNNEKGYEIASSFDTTTYFNRLGLMTITDDQGRVYPLSQTSNSVLDVLRESIKDVDVFTSSNVIRVIKDNEKYQIRTDKNQNYESDFVVFATGGKTYYKENNSYLLASMFSHRVTMLRPTLSSLKVSENLASIENLRSKVKARLLLNNQVVYEDEGEVLYKKDGLSGIVIFQLSSMIARNPYGRYKIELDLLPNMEEKDIVNHIDRFPSMIGMFPKMIMQYVIKNSPSLEKEDIAHTIKHLTFTVLENIDFKNAQVTSGGISIKEVSDNLESKNSENLYFVGEILDVDGICGGYNLQFAFASAYKVAMDIIRKVGVKQ